jgi:hypothetical protein
MYCDSSATVGKTWYCELRVLLAKSRYGTKIALGVAEGNFLRSQVCLNQALFILHRILIAFSQPTVTLSGYVSSFSAGEISVQGRERIVPSEVGCQRRWEDGDIIGCELQVIDQNSYRVR